MLTNGISQYCGIRFVHVWYRFECVKSEMLPLMKSLLINEIAPNMTILDYI